MKKIIIASGLLALMGAATSCDKYEIYPEQYGDVMMIKDGGEKEVTIYATDDAAEYGITVMKGGHSPENVTTAKLRIMTDADLSKFKETFYGDKDFAGLAMLNPEFYSFIDGEGKEAANGEIVHNFNSANDRYFTAKIVLNAQKISDWRMEMESTPEGVLELNAKKFVVPVGLYSDNDSINADNYFVMLEPVVTDPVATINVEYNGYELTQVSRTKLVDDAAFRAGTVEPEIYMEVPCKNPYGFGISYKSSASLVSTFNTAHTDVQLTNMKDAELYTLGTPKADGSGYEDVIYFPAGVTRVRVPLTINASAIDVDDLSTKYVKGIEFRPVAPKEGIDMLWGDEIAQLGIDDPNLVTEVPEKVKKSLKLPTDPENSKNNYKFFIGFQVVETPLELNDGCVTSNDCEPTEGSIAALFDNNLSTFFHSGWTVAFDRSAPFASYLEIAVPTSNPINACYFQFTSRVHSNPMSPKEVHLYYSNEDDDQLREQENAWHKFAEVKLKKKLGSGETGELGSLSNMAIAPEEFKYLRFCVMTNAKDESLTAPSTAIYWNLAELRMYGKKIEPAAAE